MVYVQVLCICLVMSTLVNARHALDTVQELHKNVGNSLLTIRKQYPESQTQVYSTIDQISKLCDISKKQYNKRKELKTALAQEKETSAKLKQRLDTVAHKLLAAQQEVENRTQRLNALKDQQEKELLAQQERAQQEKLAATNKVIPTPVEQTSLTETPSTTEA